MTKFYTPKEAAEKTGLTPQIITSYCRRGIFKGAFLFRGTRWRIPAKEVQKLIWGKLDVSQERD